MISEQITSVKEFMSKLLAADCFDNFSVVDVSISTYNTFTIDGHINKNFYSDEEFENVGHPKFSYWKDIRPICYNLIKGHKTPLKFKIILALNETEIDKLISSSDTLIRISEVNEMFLNIKFDNGILSYVTGTSLNIFTIDKSLEKAFDLYICNFISTLL